MSSSPVDLGSVGVWSPTLRQDRPEVPEAATELEELGYGTIWFPAGPPAGLAEAIQRLLRATRKTVVATGIVSVWMHPAPDIAAMHHAVTEAHPGRFLLGLGVSHQPSVDAAGLKYERPLQKMASYLDQLDSAATPVPIDERILGALGPRNLTLARDRSLGTHSYFVPVEHTRISRQAVGAAKIVAPELMVVVERDPPKARAIARIMSTQYLRLPNYALNLLRLGFSESDFANGGTDRLVDAIVAWGDPSAIVERVREHHAAGADHVSIQVLTDPPQDFAAIMDGWRQLAREFSM